MGDDNLINIIKGYGDCIITHDETFEVGDLVSVTYNDVTEKDDLSAREISDAKCVRLTVYGKWFGLVDGVIKLIIEYDHACEESMVLLIPVGCVIKNGIRKMEVKSNEKRKAE